MKGEKTMEKKLTKETMELLDDIVETIADIDEILVDIESEK